MRTFVTPDILCIPIAVKLNIMLLLRKCWWGAQAASRTHFRGKFVQGGFPEGARGNWKVATGDLLPHQRPHALEAGGPAQPQLRGGRRRALAVRSHPGWARERPGSPRPENPTQIGQLLRSSQVLIIPMYEGNLCLQAMPP